MQTFIHSSCRISALIVVGAAVVLAAADGDGYGSSDLSRSNKPSSHATLDQEAFAATGSRITALREAAPGQAIAPPLQALILPDPTAVAAFAALVQVVSTRVAHVGVYSEAEMQILAAASAALPDWLKIVPRDAGVVALAVALDRLYAEGCATGDLTALAQRRGLCEALHARCGSNDAGDFAESAKAKQFLRRKLQLLATQAPQGPIPKPVAPVNPADGF